MRIFADENVLRSIVVGPRGGGYDVLYAAESRAQTSDDDLLTETEAQGYVILTEDEDFGGLLFRDRRNSHGVILLRMEDKPAAEWLVRLQVVWATIESNPRGQFIVLTEKRLRMRLLSSP